MGTSFLSGDIQEICLHKLTERKQLNELVVFPKLEGAVAGLLVAVCPPVASWSPTWQTSCSALWQMRERARICSQRASLCVLKAGGGQCAVSPNVFAHVGVDEFEVGRPTPAVHSLTTRRQPPSWLEFEFDFKQVASESVGIARAFSRYRLNCLGALLRRTFEARAPNFNAAASASSKLAAFKQLAFEFVCAI